MGSKTKRKSMSREEEKEFIAKHKIDFLGPLSVSRWPAQYVSSFSPFREIEDVKYDDYARVAERHEDTSRRRQMKETICNTRRLQDAADYCRRSGAQEQDWRAYTENHLFRRFREKVTCRRCNGNRWRSEFQAIPLCPHSAVKVNEIRMNRILCICSQDDSLDELYVVNPDFAAKSGARFYDPNIPDAGARRPDYLLGLRRSPSLGLAQEIYPDIVWSPLRDTNDLLLPFLILEAKSEVSGFNFEAVERQTAFPIRLAVNCQKSWKQEFNNTSNFPLVWFMAYIGDLWKVYACIPNGDITEIIELWSGTIRRDDDALQLCLIVDMIYDWASDIYREDIINCLSNYESDFDCTRSETESNVFWDAQSQVSHSRIEQNYLEVYDSDEDQNRLPLPFRSSSPCPPGSFPRTPEPVDLDSRETLPDDSLPEEFSLEYISPPIISSWEANSIVQDAKKVLFTFRSLSLPETSGELSMILSVPSPADMRQNAANLLQLFNLDRPILITASFISALKNMWTGSSDTEEHPLLQSNESVYAHISFRSYLRPSDYGVVREITSISGSSEALGSLWTIAKLGPPTFLRNKKLLLQGLENVAILKRMTGSDSMRAAAQNSCLTLTIMKDQWGSPVFDWMKEDSHGEYTSNLWIHLGHQSSGIILSPIFGYSCATERICNSNEYIGSNLDELLRWADAECFFDQGAVIFKTTLTSRGQRPWYCLAIFDDTDQDYRPGLGRKLLRLLDARVLFEGYLVRDVTPEDQGFIRNWANSLLEGELVG